MQDKSKAEPEVPVWVRPEAFPSKPTGHDAYGFVDGKGRIHSAHSEDELANKVRCSRESVDLVWSPDTDTLYVPEKLPALHVALRLRFLKQAESDISDGKRMGLVFGVITLWTMYAAWKNSGGQLAAVYSHQLTGLAAMLLFFFGVLPLCEGIKMKRHLARTKPSDLLSEVPEAQFEAWLHRQRVPATYCLVLCILLCGLAQVLVDHSIIRFDASVLKAGLLKQVALLHPEQADGAAWWRMMTAPMLHGNVIHLLMNAAGLLYLGRRTESLARWPHLLVVFVAAAWVGGLTSQYWVGEKISVGASGGLVGLLGFMLVFESLHPRIVPKPARFRLLAGLLVLVVIGFLGMSFIDNAAHLGGLLAGVAYALAVFPASSSMHRPRSLRNDIIAGGAAAALILMAVIMVWVKLLA
ncbi:MAG: rhomboid family intramembrane serine protease [Akkermansiaceae bacterium]